MTHVGGLHSDESFGQSKTSFVASREVKPFLDPKAFRDELIDIARKGIGILEAGTAAGASTTIYTTPPGKKSFITSIFLGGRNVSISAAQIIIRKVLSTGQFTNIMLIQLDSGATQYLTWNFHFPLVLDPGDFIRLTSNDAAFTAIGTVIGWEENKEI